MSQEKVIAAGLDELFASSDPSMDNWRKMMDEAGKVQQIKSGLDPAIYAACFHTEAGRLVLQDLYARYVHVTRAVPGQGADAAFYREGMAQVVFDIVDKINVAENGD